MTCLAQNFPLKQKNGHNIEHNIDCLSKTNIIVILIAFLVEITMALLSKVQAKENISPVCDCRCIIKTI